MGDCTSVLTFTNFNHEYSGTKFPLVIIGKMTLTHNDKNNNNNNNKQIMGTKIIFKNF